MSETTQGAVETKPALCQNILEGGGQCPGGLEFGPADLTSTCDECGGVCGSLNALYLWPHASVPWPQQIQAECNEITHAWQVEHDAGHPHSIPTGRGRPCPICQGHEITEHHAGPDINAERPRWTREFRYRRTLQRSPEDPRTLKQAAYAHLVDRFRLDPVDIQEIERGLTDVGFMLEAGEIDAARRAEQGDPVVFVDITATSHVRVARAPHQSRHLAGIGTGFEGVLKTGETFTCPVRFGSRDFTEIARIATTYIQPLSVAP